jgi:pimeloyl-ACP methyl ester carboxylesterase/DNA-binding transcriptional ArsR family regulator
VVPSVFLACTPCVVFDRRDPEGIPVLVYPTPLDLGSAMRLWGSAGGSDGALGAVIGRTRANILGALSDSRTTTELGRMLGISAAAASQHTAILRDAGLITTRRRMNTVLHSLTPLSLALVKGKDFAFGGCCGRTGMTVAGPPKPRAVERGSPMPVLRVNDVVLNYRDSGSGEPVVLVMGSGGGGQAWHLYQVPALTAAGYRVVTFDNRGIPPSSEGPDGFIVRDLVADTAGLIERLGAAPCHLVGTSMGAYVAQELALARPELVRRVVLMATHGRCDAVRTALARAEVELADSGVCLTAGYRAVVQALQSLSPQTLNDDKQMVDWLDLFELAQRGGPGVRSQLRLSPMPDRLAAYRGIRVPCHVIAFADDLVTPPYLGREVAEAIPGAGYEVLAGCGHYGYLEQPDAVNASILRFLRG